MKWTPEFVKQLNDNPLYTTIGIRIEGVGRGEARSSLRPDHKLFWPFPGQLHGGILFTLMDTTMAWAASSELDPGWTCSTISLNIQYTSAARGNYFSCRACTAHRTGRLSFVRSEIHDSNDQLVAIGQATFRIVKIDTT